MELALENAVEGRVHETFAAARALGLPDAAAHRRIVGALIEALAA